jgi:DNA-binding transcriptional regulator YhcF (GntR family)
LKINEDSLTPLYVQIADSIEEDILNDTLKEGSACYSQLIIARELSVNPATAAKGINLLVVRGVLEKQRGLAMIVKNDAKETIIQRKTQTVFESKVEELVRMAKSLNLSENYVLRKLTQYFKEESE